MNDIRWKERFQNFKRAFQQLSDAAALAEERALSALEQLGFIHLFEFIHELAWNTMKDFLESRGAAQLFGSKDATRQGFATGLIENGDVWMEMIQSRNQATHTYDSNTADAVALAVRTVYVSEFARFLTTFTAFEEAE